jgi:hypothetical protein
MLTRRTGLAFIRLGPIVLSLTLLRNVSLEIRDVTDEGFLSSFPTAYALLKLLAIPFEEFVVR